MPISKYKILLLLIPVILFITGCQSIEHHSSMKKYQPAASDKKIAIVTFESLAPNIKSGEDMAKFCYNQFFTQLYIKENGRVGPFQFNMMDENKLTKIMHENKWLNQSAYLEVGMDKFTKTLGCDMLLLGTVSEYHYKRGLGEDPVIGLHLRLYDCETKSIIWTGSHSSVGRFSWFKEDSLSRLGQQVSQTLAKKCFRDLRQQLNNGEPN
jgi:polysaccharide biosynthesis protein PelC